MAIPSTYTEPQLQRYMLETLEGAGEQFGWDITDFEEQVNDTLILCRIDDIADVDSIAKLRAVARYVAWDKAVNKASQLYDFQADGGSFSRSKMVEAMRKQRDAARVEAARYVSSLSAADLSLDAGLMTVGVEASW